jgi:hypothetical protein
MTERVATWLSVLGQTLGHCGDWMRTVIVLGAVSGVRPEVRAVAGLFLCAWVPLWIGEQWAAARAARWRTWRVVVGLEWVRVMVACGVIGAVERAHLGMIYGLIGGLALCTGIAAPFRTALLQQLLSVESFRQVGRVLAWGRPLTMVVAALVGGTLSEIEGALWAIQCAVLLMATGAMCQSGVAFWVRRDEGKAEAGQERSERFCWVWVPSIQAGWSALLGKPLGGKVLAVGVLREVVAAVGLVLAVDGLMDVFVFPWFGLGVIYALIGLSYGLGALFVQELVLWNRLDGQGALASALLGLTLSAVMLKLMLTVKGGEWAFVSLLLAFLLQVIVHKLLELTLVSPGVSRKTGRRAVGMWVLLTRLTACVSLALLLVFGAEWRGPAAVDSFLVSVLFVSGGLYVWMRIDKR